MGPYSGYRSESQYRWLFILYGSFYLSNCSGSQYGGSPDRFRDDFGRVRGDPALDPRWRFPQIILPNNFYQFDQFLQNIFVFVNSSDFLQNIFVWPHVTSGCDADIRSGGFEQLRLLLVLEPTIDLSLACHQLNLWNILEYFWECFGKYFGEYLEFVRTYIFTQVYRIWDAANSTEVKLLYIFILYHFLQSLTSQNLSQICCQRNCICVNWLQRRSRSDCN